MDLRSLDFINVHCSYGFEGTIELAPFLPQTFSLAPANITTIEGDNGSGKSSLLRALLGEVPEATGIVKLTTKDDTRAVPIRHLVKTGLRIFYMPQRVYTMFPVENCAATAVDMWGRVGGVYVTEKDRRTLFARLNVENFMKRVQYRRCENLTGGEAQMMAVLLGILYRPSLVLLDEPTAALSEENKPLVRELIQRLLLPDDGSPVFSLVVTHDNTLATTALHRIQLTARSVFEGLS